MALRNDTLEIVMTSPDYTDDWGVVGNPLYVTLDLMRSSASVLEMQIAADDPAREYLLRDRCGIQVRFRGRIEFVGRVYLRQGGVNPSDPVTIWAHDETIVLDETLAWPNPGYSFKNPEFTAVYTSGKLQPESTQDTAQSFPEPFISTGHYDWALPFLQAAGPIMGTNAYAWPWATGYGPSTAGQFVTSVIFANLDRIGYTRMMLSAARETGARVDMRNTNQTWYGSQAQMVTDLQWQWELDTPPPWVDTFAGADVRFDTLRSVVQLFQEWADANDERSFSIEATADATQPGTPNYLTMREGPLAYPTPLTVEGGTVVAGDWSIGDASATRIILGGPGEMGERLFVERRLASREVDDYIVETFKDATGWTLMSTGVAEFTGRSRNYFVSEAQQAQKNRATSYFNQSANKLFQETAPETGLSVDLQESESVYFGGDIGYRLGQRVTVDLGWRVFEDRVNQVTISLTSSGGLQVTPRVGSIVMNDDESRARALRTLADRQRTASSER